MDKERIEPIKITDNDSGNVYVLDFTRDSVRFAESRGFKLEDVPDYPTTKFEEFFFFAFRAHHKNLPREKANKLYEKMGGMTDKVLTRLIDLYQQAQVANNIQDEDDLAANPHVTVEL